MNYLPDGKMMKRSFRLLLAMILFLACDFLKLERDFVPTGDPYTLNPNIELIRIQESLTRYNSTGTFSLDFIARSKSNNPETAILPAGLFFISQNPKVQNMIIVKDFGITVTSNTDTFTIGAFSVNEFKALPGDSDFFQIGPITNHPDLLRIIDIVKDKKLNADNVFTVQRAIYQVTSEGSLSSAMVESLNSLPPATNFRNELLVISSKN